MARAIKLFEDFEKIPSIRRFHETICIFKLSRNDDGTYDYDGDLDFERMGLKSLTEIPLKIKNVNGRFNCSYNELVSLEGAPEIVQGNFDCYSNKLVSLEGAPDTIKGNFDCYSNKLVSLEGAPDTIQGDFRCSDNNLLSDKHLSKVNGKVYCDKNLFKKTEKVIESISKMSYDTQMKQLNFLGKMDITAYDIFLEILEELGVDVSVRKELSNISKASGLDDIGF
jgi:hypothetical protein